MDAFKNPPIHCRLRMSLIKTIIHTPGGFCLLWFIYSAIAECSQIRYRNTWVWIRALKHKTDTLNDTLLIHGEGSWSLSSWRYSQWCWTRALLNQREPRDAGRMVAVCVQSSRLNPAMRPGVFETEQYQWRNNRRTYCFKEKIVHKFKAQYLTFK